MCDVKNNSVNYAVYKALYYASSVLVFDPTNCMLHIIFPAA